VTESITLEQLNIPNVITANSDGINDILQINPLFQNCSTFELLIHNRWGHLVFKSTSSDVFFSGNDLDGNVLQEGVYFYYLKTEIGDKQGAISIIK
jgi:gliding motility-associated-like protein